MRLPGTLDCNASRSILKGTRGWRRRLNSRRPRYDLLEERALMTTYNIGPGQTYTTLGSFTWSSLRPGDTVDIHWQSGGYHEKLLLTENGTTSEPINIVGVPGPNGELPIIDGENATTSSQFQYFYNPLQEDAVVMITKSKTGNIPSNINISGLDIRDGYQGNTFTDNTGKTQTYSAFAASLWIEGASNITIQNSNLDNSGLGLFALTNDSNGLMTSNLVVEGNSFYNNGVSGSYLEHNSYCEVNGITYEYNDYGPLRSGSQGAELKDRSAGTVISYNYFTPAATILDLVDAEDSATLRSLPSYQNTYVYGNIIDDTGPNYTSIPVEFGGDSGNTSGYRPDLYFYDNTVVTLANQSSAWRTNMFELFTSGQSAWVNNNIFYNGPATAGAKPTLFEFATNQGNITFGQNWVSPGWLTSKSAELGQSFSGTISGTSNFFTDPNNNSPFVSLSGDNYQLSSTSSAIGIAGTLGSSWPAVTEEYVAPTSGTARTSLADDGAYQYGPVADPPATPPVGDAGFEQPYAGPAGVWGSFIYDPTGTAWSFAGAAGVSANGSGFTSGNPAAPEGAQVGFVQTTGSLSQSVAGWAGGSYVITFDAAQRGNNGGSDQNFEVLVDGNVVSTFTPSGTSYQNYSTAAFTVAAGSQTITIQGLDSAGGDNTAFVDAVAVEVTKASVPLAVTSESPTSGSSSVAITSGTPGADVLGTTDFASGDAKTIPSARTTTNTSATVATAPTMSSPLDTSTTTRSFVAQDWRDRPLRWRTAFGTS